MQETNLYKTRRYKEERRLSLRWLDSTVQDVQILGIKKCKAKALGRNQERSIVEEVKA
jgi:hypothetical protein